MEIADVLRMRKVDIACVQEVKWKGSKAWNVGHGYKLFYHGDTSNRNGVGIILREERTKDILEISRISDRIILLKLACTITRGHNDHICLRTRTRTLRVGKRQILRTIGDSDQTSRDGDYWW